MAEESRVLEILKEKPLSALQVAKAAGLITAAEINPLLYKMLEKGLVAMTTDQLPPLWTALVITQPQPQPQLSSFLNPKTNVRNAVDFYLVKAFWESNFIISAITFRVQNIVVLHCTTKPTEDLAKRFVTECAIPLFIQVLLYVD